MHNKKKRKAWLKYQSTLLPIDYIEYTKCRNASIQAVRRAKYNFEKNLINDLPVDIKRFWKYVQSKTKVKQSVASINKPDGTITVDDIEIASVLNEFFGSGFTNEDLSNMPSLDAKYIGEPLLSVDILDEDVCCQLCRLNPSKSGSPDRCNPLVFVEVKDGLLTFIG